MLILLVSLTSVIDLYPNMKQGKSMILLFRLMQVRVRVSKESD